MDMEEYMGIQMIVKFGCGHKQKSDTKEAPNFIIHNNLAGGAY